MAGGVDRDMDLQDNRGGVWGRQARTPVVGNLRAEDGMAKCPNCTDGCLAEVSCPGCGDDELICEACCMEHLWDAPCHVERMIDEWREPDLYVKEAGGG